MYKRFREGVSLKPSSSESTPKRSGSPLLVGLVAVWGLVLLGSLLAALLLQYASVNEDYMPYFTFVINGIALLGGGWISGRSSGKKGWLYGGSVGCLYRSEEHTSELQSRENLVCRLLLEKKKKNRRRRR